MRTTIEFLTPHAQHYDIFLPIFEYTIRDMAGYSGKFNSMVGIHLHDCKEPDMVGLFDGNSHEVS